MSVRVLRGSDVPTARALIAAQFGATPYEARLVEQLELAISGDDPECQALVVGDEPRALVLFGSIAGANGVLKLHALAGEGGDDLRSLATAVLDIGARLIVCEISEDASFDVTGQIVRELGFEEAGRVADFFRDGVDLVIVTWRSP